MNSTHVIKALVMLNVFVALSFGAVATGAAQDNVSFSTQTVETKEGRVQILHPPENGPSLSPREEWEAMPLERREALKERFQNLSDEDKAQLKSKYKKYKELSPERQQDVRERYRQFKRLSPEKRKMIRENYGRMRDLSPQQRERLINKYKEYQNLPKEQRERVKQNFGRFRDMSPQERQQLWQKKKRWDNMTPEKREQFKERFRDSSKTQKERFKVTHETIEPGQVRPTQGQNKPQRLMNSPRLKQLPANRIQKQRR